jgi:homoserine dehydrogenase
MLSTHPAEGRSSPLAAARTATIGLFGCGTVGGGVAARLLREPSILGVSTPLGPVLVRDPRKARTPAGIGDRLTGDPEVILGDPEVRIVVEAIGGIELPLRLVEAALRAGKHVVTANKALVATHGARLARLADERHLAFRYEAAVAGAIPVVRTLHETLAAEEVLEVSGVLNGTSNVIVRAMSEGGDYLSALREAQDAGYAEADPSADVDGHDAANKLSILAGPALRVHLDAHGIARRSLRTLRPVDVERAHAHGLALIALSLARRSGEAIEALVAPACAPAGDEIARLRGPENLVRVVGAFSGPLAFRGRGAGRDATASAVVSDIAEIVRRIARWQRQDVQRLDFPSASLRPPALRHFIAGDAGEVAALVERRLQQRVEWLADDAVLSAPLAVDPARDWGDLTVLPAA